MKSRRCYETHKHCNGNTCNYARWLRVPEHDRRIARGDDFAGDAWRNAETGEVQYTAVGHNLKD